MLLHTVELLFIYICNDNGFVHILKSAVLNFFSYRIVCKCLLFGSAHFGNCEHDYKDINIQLLFCHYGTGEYLI